MSPDAWPGDTPTGIPWFVACKKERKKKGKEKLSTSNEKVFIFSQTMRARDYEAYQICEINRCPVGRENDHRAKREIFLDMDRFWI